MDKDSPIPEKLLDAWVPPVGAGDPVGFISTTFTFNASFFEEDCLGSFLQLESDPDSESLSYIIEREEKLYKTECAMVLVDQHHCRTNRNIRWDLIPVRVPRGIQHAKISLLYWTDCIRIVIASANLTPEGYRRNQEVFTVLDAKKDSKIPVDVFEESFIFIESLLNETVTDSQTFIDRGKSLIKRARKTIGKWNTIDQNADTESVHIWPVFVKPGSQSAFSQLRNIWNQYYSYLPDTADIISPFFDEKYTEKGPLPELIGFMNGRDCALNFFCTGEPLQDKNNRIRLNAPEYLQKESPDNTYFYHIPETVEPNNEYRALHMKSMRFYKGNWIMIYMGSGNFTSAGLNSGSNSNYEANLAFISNSSRSPEAYDVLKEFLPEGEELDPEKISWQPVSSEDAAEDNVSPVLPGCILSAEADLADQKVIIRFYFDTTKGLPELTIRTEDGTLELDKKIIDECIFRNCLEYIWHDRVIGSQTEKALPAGFEVCVGKSDKKSWLPLNVLNYDCLPPPEHLRELPLSILLQLLTSAKPLHLVLKRYFKNLNQNDDDQFEPEEIIDPHKRVDTSGFLLQRTRRISYAFNAIRQKFSVPISTMPSLQWKLYGPVGLKALVHAIQNDQVGSQFKIPEERLFFIAELIFELSTIQPVNSPNCLPARTIKKEVAKFIEQIAIQIKKDPALRESWIKQYVNKTLNRALGNS